MWGRYRGSFLHLLRLCGIASCQARDYPSSASHHRSHQPRDTPQILVDRAASTERLSDTCTLPCIKGFRHNQDTSIKQMLLVCNAFLFLLAIHKAGPTCGSTRIHQYRVSSWQPHPLGGHPACCMPWKTLWLFKASNPEEPHELATYKVLYPYTF